MLQSADATMQADMTSSYESLQELLKQIDQDTTLSPSILPTFQRLQKQFVAVNFLIEDLMQQQYGLMGINFDNIEDVYNTHVTGLKTLAETRDYLIERGMSDSFAEKLMYQYLRKIAGHSHICSLLDLFTDADSKGHLNRAPITEIYANYVNMHALTPGLLKQDLYQQSKFKPIAPMNVRMFSSMFADVKVKQTSLDDEKKANKFLEFIKTAEEIDREVTGNLDFNPDEIDIGFSNSSEPDGGKDSLNDATLKTE